MSDIYRDTLLAEFDREFRVTRDVLSRVPSDKLDWKPHEKSMSLKSLAAHIATIPDWVVTTLIEPGLSFQAPPKLPKLETAEAIVSHFDELTVRCRDLIASFTEQQWAEPWKVSNGDKVLFTGSRLAVYRLWDFNHMIHHRGQLNLYLRLLDVPVATIYFNSADEPEMRFE